MNESNSIEITIDSSDSNFSISGDVGIIQSNRRLRSNFESYGAIFDNNLILIQNLMQTLQYLIKDILVIN